MSNLAKFVKFCNKFFYSLQMDADKTVMLNKIQMIIFTINIQNFHLHPTQN